MITETNYSEWKNSLKGDEKKTRKFFTHRGEVHYRSSENQILGYYNDPMMPKMVRCYSSGMLVWEGETTRVRTPDGKDAHISALENKRGVCVVAHWDEDRSATMLKVDCIKVDGSHASKHLIGKCVLQCAKTGRWHFRWNMMEFGGDLVGQSWINSCMKNLVNQQHNWRPEEFIIPKSKQYAGIELEIESIEGDSDWRFSYISSAEMLTQGHDDYLFLKRDGSLQNGYEIVTHPIDWEVIRDRFSSVLPSLTSFGMRSHESGRCGLHVHLPRNSMTRLEVAKLVVLWNSDHDFIHMISGRSGNKAQSRNGRNYCQLIRDPRLMFNGGPGCVDHYSAINTQNSDTVEFRSFRGTLNRDTFLGRIGITFMVRDYVKQCSVNPSWNDFLLWAIRSPHERKRFPESWSLLSACVEKHNALSDEVRKAVASTNAKKSNTKSKKVPTKRAKKAPVSRVRSRVRNS